VLVAIDNTLDAGHGEEASYAREEAERAVEHVAPAVDDADLLSDREVIKLFASGKRPPRWRLAARRVAQRLR
jgi:hypothetical protein